MSGRNHFPHLGLHNFILLVSILFMVLVIGLSRISYSDDLKNLELVSSILNLRPEVVTSDAEQKIARSGCCSWHGAVCDCIGGRVVCCDGTFSLSCRCHHDNNKDVLNFEE